MIMADSGSPLPEFMLTTFDNPYDPFTQWDEWYAWDATAGYCTPGLLARISYSSDEISDADQFLAIQQAIDEIVRENVSGMHRKIQRGEFAKLADETAQGQASQ
jgi:hypothetical protein